MLTRVQFGGGLLALLISAGGALPCVAQRPPANASPRQQEPKHEKPAPQRPSRPREDRTPQQQPPPARALPEHRSAQQQQPTRQQQFPREQIRPSRIAPREQGQNERQMGGRENSPVPNRVSPDHGANPNINHGSRDSNAGRFPNPNRPPNAYNGNPNRPPNAVIRPRDLPPEQRQKVVQNESRFNQLSPQQKQEMRARARVWQDMTPVQRDHIKNEVLPKWQQLPPDRQKAIQQRLGVLKNMPESARNQHLNDPNFTRGMSEEDRATLRDLSHLHVGGAPEPPNE